MNTYQLKKATKTLSLTLLLMVSLSFTTVQANVIIPASDPTIHYEGRWIKDPSFSARTGRGAAYIKAGFTGPSVAIELGGTEKDIWWHYSIDGSPLQRIKPEGSKPTILASTLPEGKHQLYLIRDTEGSYGISEFSGLILADGATMTPSKLPAPHRIEIIGDSIAAGAWDMGLGEYREFENGGLAFGPQLAQLLHAECSVVARSGEGVVRNYAESGKEPILHPHAKDNYVRTFSTKLFPTWDFNTIQPEAVLIAYGTNDFVDKDNHPSYEQFETGYTELVRLVRSKNPKAVIICLEPVPSWLDPQVRNTIESAVTKLRNQGDKNIYFIPLNANGPLLAPEDFVGDGTHPLISGQQKIATYLKDRVEAVMGWNQTINFPELWEQLKND